MERDLYATGANASTLDALCASADHAIRQVGGTKIGWPRVTPSTTAGAPTGASWETSTSSSSARRLCTGQPYLHETRVQFSGHCYAGTVQDARAAMVAAAILANTIVSQTLRERRATAS